MLAMKERKIGTLNIDEVTTAPLQFTKAVRLNTAQAEVFDFVRDHADWSSWFPVVEAVKVDDSQAAEPGGNGCVRHCTLVNGAQFAENIIGYDAPRQFGYAIEANNPFGVDEHLAVITVEAESDDSSRLTWYQFFNHQDAQVFINDANGILDEGINNLIGRFGGELLETIIGQ